MPDINTPILHICSRGHPEIVYKFLGCPLCLERAKTARIYEELEKYKKGEGKPYAPTKTYI